MRKGLVALLPAILLVAIAIWEIAATARATASVPGDRDWDRAEAAVRAQEHPGDLIVFAPDWIDPVGRLHLGDLITLDDAARMDADRYAVIWELSIRGARAPETRGLTPTSEQDFGGVTVRRFDRTPVTVVSDLVWLAPHLTVRGNPDRDPSVELAEVGFAPHRCIQVVPHAGASVELDFGQVALGTTLVGYVGLADVFTRRDVRDPGRLELRIDDQPQVSVTAGVDDGWQRFEVDTTPGDHHVVFVATAVGAGARDRRICFAAEARR